MSFRSIDLPRAVKFKARKTAQRHYIPNALKAGRTYDDFLAFIAHNEIPSWVETATVIGRVGGKTILTLHFTACNFMFGLLLNSNSAEEAAAAFVRLKKLLDGHGSKFSDVFPVLLTDNGGEFSNVFDIENDSLGQRESRLFFCDPYRSSQKPRVEKHHALFRNIAPKDSSFDDFTQDTLNTIFSHVNSVKRALLFGKTAYEHFAFLFSINSNPIITSTIRPLLLLFFSEKLPLLILTATTLSSVALALKIYELKRADKA